MSIELTFIGHQSWMVSSGGTNVLVDPILGRTSGNMVGAAFEMPIYPPRSVDVAAMPQVHGVVLSHEHVDHFDIATFARLERGVPVYVGELMLDSVVRAIEAVGARVIRVPALQEFSIGAFHCMLFPATKADVWYEHRATQMLFWTGEDSIFNTVDCQLSPELGVQVQLGQVPAPRSLILTNNGMYPSDGARRAYYNVNPKANDTRDGIGCLRELFDCLRLMSGVENVFMMGNGLLPFGGKYGPFLWADMVEIADIMNSLSTGPRVHGPYPGHVFRIAEKVEVGSAPWIHFDRDEMRALEALIESTKDAPPPRELPVLTAPFESEEQAVEARNRLESELPNLAARLLASPFGQSLQVIDTPEYPELGARRLLLRFQGGPGGQVLQYALDINRAEFVADDTNLEQLTQVFPHGLEMQLCDFIAVLEGRLAAMDLFYAEVRAWFIEEVQSKDDQILAALAAIYGDHASQRLAWELNKRAVEHHAGS